MADNALLGPAAARRNVLLDGWEAGKAALAEAWYGPQSPITGGPMFDPRATPLPTSGREGIGQVLAEYQDPAKRGVGVNTVTGFAEGPAAIRAFHGSPHSFDRFDMSKLGTGEGAQVYGHGLYFAGNEGVARSYRDTLSSGQTALRTLGNAPDDVAARVAEISSRNRTDGGFDDVVARLSKERDYHIDQAQKVFERDVLPRDPDMVAAQFQANATQRQSDLDFLMENQKHLAPYKGHMYEVSLQTEPNRLLDWDAPKGGAAADRFRSVTPAEFGLEAQRSRLNPGRGVEYVSTAADRVFGRAPGEVSSVADLLQGKGSDVYEQFRSLAPDASSAGGAQALRQAGLDGIQYYDGMSRGAGTGSRNYVMFDDATIQILRKYGLLPLTAGGAAAAVAPDE